MDTDESDSYGLTVTTPQNPWQPGGQQPQYGTPAGGYPQQGQPPQYPQPGQYPQSAQHPQPGGYPQPDPYSQQGGYQACNPYGAPPAPQANMAPVERPMTINAAFWIAVVVPLVATVLLVVSALMTQGMLNDAAAAAGLDDTELTNSIFIGATVFSTIFYVILTGLWILFGFKLRAGRNWARIVLTIFAALWVLSSLFGLMTGGGYGDLPPGMDVSTGLIALTYAQNALGLVAMAAFITLVFLRPSNWYVQASSHR